MWCFQPERRRPLALFARSLTYPADFNQVTSKLKYSMDSSRHCLLNALITTAEG